MVNLKYVVLILTKCYAYINQVISESSVPPATIFSSLAYDPISNRSISYGGTNSRITSIYSSFYSFDFNTDSWSEIISESSITPPKLYSSFSYIYKSKFYLIFGRNDTEIFLYSYSFDLVNGKWNIVNFLGDEIKAPVEAASTLFDYKGKSYFGIHGGVTTNGASQDLYL